MASGQTPGIVRVRWNNANLPMEKGAKYKPAGRKANQVVLGEEVNFSYEFQAGEFSGTSALKRGQRFTDLYVPGPGELQGHLDPGQVFTHPDAVLEETPEMNSDGGKIELKWFFGRGTEQ